MCIFFGKKIKDRKIKNAFFSAENEKENEIRSASTCTCIKRALICVHSSLMVNSPQTKLLNKTQSIKCMWRKINSLVSHGFSAAQLVQNSHTSITPTTYLLMWNSASSSFSCHFCCHFILAVTGSGRAWRQWHKQEWAAVTRRLSQTWRRH